MIGLNADWPGWLHGSNWVWVRHIPERLWWRDVLLLGVLTVGGLMFHIAIQGEIWHRRKTTIFLTMMIVFTVGVQLVIAAQHRTQPLAVPFWSSSGFFLEGVRISDPAEFLQNHYKSMPHYRDVHIRTQPPGWPLTYWAVSRVMSQFPNLTEPLGHWFRRYDCLAFDLQGLTLTQIASSILSISLLFISGLGVLPLYRLGQQLFSARIARTTAAFYPFLPAFLTFQGRFVTFYAVISLTALWLLTEIMLNNRRWPVTILGLLLGGITFWGFGPIAIVLIINLFMLSYLVQRLQKRQDTFHLLSFILHPFLTVNVAIALVVLLLWGSLWLIGGINGLSMFQRSQALHQEVRINYPNWRLFNLYDMAVFMGIPLAIGGVLGLINSFRRIIKLPAAGYHPLIHQRAFIVSWGLSVLILNFSGQVRAETGRLWLFLFTPGLLIGVAGWNSYLTAKPQDSGHRRGTVWGYLLFVTYMVQALTVGYFLGGRIPPSTVPEPVWVMPKTAVSLDYQLGETIQLQGYEMQTMPHELHLTLYWKAIQRPMEDYSAFAHLIGGDSTLLAQSDSLPQQGNLPTWCWVPGEIVADKRILPLNNAQAVAPADRVIGIGLYDWRTGVRLPITPPTANDMILLPLIDQ